MLNRRKFVAALLATPLLSHLVRSNVALSDEVTECVKPKPLTDPRVLIVSPTYAQANEIWKHMKHKEAAMCIGVGAAICGRVFDHVIIDEAADMANIQTSTWLHNAVHTRLAPGGSMVDLRWSERGIDYSTGNTIQATFSDSDKARYDMTSIRRQHSLFLDDEWHYRAKAQLLDWYIEQRGWHE